MRPENKTANKQPYTQTKDGMIGYLNEYEYNELFNGGEGGAYINPRPELCGKGVVYEVAVSVVGKGKMVMQFDTVEKEEKITK